MFVKVESTQILCVTFGADHNRVEEVLRVVLVDFVKKPHKTIAPVLQLLAVYKQHCDSHREDGYHSANR